MFIGLLNVYKRLLRSLWRAGFCSWHGLKWESWYLLAVGPQFTVQNLDELNVLVSSAHKTSRHDMTCTVLKAT